MPSFYVSITVNLLKVVDIIESYTSIHGVTKIKNIVGKNVNVHVNFYYSEKTYKSKDQSKQSIINEIREQIGLDEKYKNNYPPSVVENLKTYIVLKIELPVNDDVFTIEKGSSLTCCIEEISPYYLRMTESDVTKLINAKHYICSKEFMNDIKSIKSDAKVVDGIYGIVIIGNNLRVMLLSGFKCIMLRTFIDSNVFPVLTRAWESYMERNPGVEYTEQPIKLNDSDKAAYIMLDETPMEELLKDKQFLKDIMAM